MLRIGIVCYPTYGGSGAAATELGCQLAARGHTIHIMAYDRPFRLNKAPFQENLYLHEIATVDYSLMRSELYTLSAAVTMAQLVEEAKLDILHSHYAVPHAVSALLARDVANGNQRVKLVTTLHGTDITLVGSHPAFLPVVRMGISRSDAVVSVSHWLAEETRRRFGLCGRGANCCVIHNFVDPEVYKPRDDAECRRKAFARPEEKIVLHISNFRPVKRVADAIRVFAGILREQPAVLLMIGDGPDRGKAWETARELGVLDRVRFLGFQDDVAGMLSLADLFLFPSEYESFGLVVAEAMASEVPVVCTDGGGLPEVMAHGETGYLCEVGNIEEMTARSVEILKNPEKAETMGRAGRRRAMEHFSPEKAVKAYENLYEALLRGERVPQGEARAT